MPATPSGMSWKPLAGAVLVLVLLGLAGYWYAGAWFVHPDYRAAQEALARRADRQAVAHLRKYLEAHPDDLAARLLAARTARRRGDLDTAVVLLNPVLPQLEPTPDLELERLLLRVQQGEPGEVERLLAEVASAPAAPRARLLLEAVIEGSVNRLAGAMWRERDGAGALAQTDLARAHAAVDRWLEWSTAAPEQARGLAWRGRLHSIAREFGPAQECFRRAFALDPAAVAAREGLAILLLQESPQEAAEHLEALHAADSSNARLSHLLATVRWNLGQPDRAAQLFDALLADAPTNVPLLLDRGRLALEQQHLELAGQAAQAALNLAPESPAAHLLMSQYLRQAEQPAEAKRFHERFVELDAQEQRRRAAPPGPR